MKNYKELLKKINTLIFDYDGVFTDGIVYLTDNGELLRTSNTRDGYAVQLAVKKGFNVAVITGGKNQAVKIRMNKLGVEHAYTHVSNKPEILREFLEKSGARLSETLYMADDIPDLPAMEKVVLPCCPADAVEEVKHVCHYISDKEGGRGAVRDIIEQVLKAQNLWMNDDAYIW